MKTARRGGTQRRLDFADPLVPSSSRPRLLEWWARLLGASALVTFIAVPAAPVSAVTMVPAEPQNLQSLKDEADELGEEYRGELRDLEGVIQAAEDAEERAEESEEALEEARDAVRTIAVTSYVNGGVDPALDVFVAEDAEELAERARYVHHLTTTNSDRIDQHTEAIEEYRAAQDEAEATLAEADEDLSGLRDRREEVQELIADHPEQEMGGRYNLTPRTEQMRELIIEEFDEGPGVGCYRPHNGGFVGEHPKGRACDFMMTNDGDMPPQDEIDRGWEISEWARENADRLGIMYVIYRQQIWDQRRGDTDWRDMADRGSITENHFDHVHISMW
ncbi:hypothetical protein J4H86_25430 [Spiractinospora alimapuensis]|uniref:coiled-coil domain-containing protein n=1 Tax=Spiractinospora alimapuensis TaxID=2820884 RepID=UPI001F2257B3|nr:hypothetical protein [Spiractinospora alimapuensis]QVQ52035.1 hypothetical protein J4H86_25430 [Spiractinospora alimapuensis]